MAEWRIARGWSDRALRERLEGLSGLRRNFGGNHEEHLVHPGWETHRSRSRIGTVEVGPPPQDGAFARARAALADYAFSDPGIVEAHFDPCVPLEDRRMLLEIKVGPLHYLCGAVVGAVRDRRSDGMTSFGFRYDTLEGHIESGAEWFVLEKSHDSGDVIFEIEASWRPGDFPNWWSKLGFKLVGRRYQRKWHVLAHRRMAAFLAGWPTTKPFGDHELAHQGPEIEFDRSEAVHFTAAVGGAGAEDGPGEGGRER